MSKWYEVDVRILRTVVVEIEDDVPVEEALELAEDIAMTAMDGDEAEGDWVMTAFVDSAIRNADKVVRLEE